MSILQFSHPRHIVNVEDRSQIQVQINRDLPLFRPFFYIRAEAGPPNEPIWYDTFQQAVAVLGEQTFNTTNPEYYVPAIDMIRDIFNSNGCYIARAETDEAMPACALLVADVQENIDTPVYQIDELSGNFIYVDDERVPVLDTDGNPTFTKGMHIDYRLLTDWQEIYKAVYLIDDAELANDMYQGRAAVDTLIQYIRSNPLAMDRQLTDRAAAAFDTTGLDFTTGFSVTGLTGFTYTADAGNTIDTLADALAATAEIHEVVVLGDDLSILFTTPTGVPFNLIDDNSVVYALEVGDIATTPAEAVLDVTGMDYTQAITATGLTGFSYVADAGNDITTLATALTGAIEIDTVTVDGTELTVVYQNTVGTAFEVTDGTLTIEVAADDIVDLAATASLDVAGLDFTDALQTTGLTGFVYAADDTNTIDTLATALTATTEIHTVTVTGTTLSITFANTLGVAFTVKDNNTQDRTITIEMIETYATTTVPVALFRTEHPGEYGNDYGFQIRPNLTLNTTRAINNRKGFVYDFAPFRKRFGTINPVAIKSVFSGDEFSAGLTRGMIDPATNISYDMQQVIQQSYPTSRPLGMEVQLFNANISMVAIMASYLEESIPTPNVPVRVPDEIHGGFKWNDALSNEERFLATQSYTYYGMFNMFGFRDPDGSVYQAIRTTDAQDADVTNYTIGNRFYLESGRNGDLDDRERYTEQFSKFFGMDVNPFIEDQARYPFNFVPDCGFVLQNKFDIIDFMAVRDDIVVECGTSIHPAYHPDPKWTGVVTPREDISIGAVLRERALLTRESVEKGTQSCRTNIYANAGFREGKQGPYGLQYWVMRKLSMYDNRTFLDREIRGLPNAEVDMFTDMTWVPSTKELKELTWTTKLNYAQYYDMSRLHMAGRQSVYLTDGGAFSVLDDAGFVKDIVYTKHIVRQIWAKFAGVNLPVKELQMQLQNEVTTRLNHMFNGKYQFVAHAYQNELDRAMGYVQRVMIKIVTGAPYWVGPFDIICYRDTQVGALDIDV